MPRQLPASAYKHLKPAARRQIEASGKLESAARATRVSKTPLGYYASPAHPTHFVGPRGPRRPSQGLLGLAAAAQAPVDRGR